MENPIEIVPEPIVYPDEMTCLDYAFSNSEYESNCDYCGASLTTEIEMLNCICLACMNEEEREAKIRSFDDLAYACHVVLNLADVIGEDIRSSYRNKWNLTSRKLCEALRNARYL